MDPCFFGCDICQEVCPFNKGDLADQLSIPSGDEILAMGEQDFGKRLGATALARTGLKKIKGNIQAIRSARGKPE
jgi:epoxyqueuosine reductase